MRDIGVGEPSACPVVRGLLSMLKANALASLLGKRLPQANCKPNSCLSFVDNWQVSKFSRKVFALPKQVNKGRHDIVILEQELMHDLRIKSVPIVQINSCCELHHIPVSSRCYYSVSSKALIAAWVFFLPLLCPYNRAANEVNIATRSSIKSLIQFSAELITSIRKRVKASNPLLTPLPAQAQTIQHRNAEGFRLYQEGVQPLNRGQCQEALQIVQQALVIFREISDHKAQSLMLYKIADTDASLGTYAQALNGFNLF